MSRKDCIVACICNVKLCLINFAEFEKKEAKKKVHEEVIAEDYDNTKEEINQIDISQKIMVNMTMMPNVPPI